MDRIAGFLIIDAVASAALVTAYMIYRVKSPDDPPLASLTIALKYAFYFVGILAGIYGLLHLFVELICFSNFDFSKLEHALLSIVWAATTASLLYTAYRLLFRWGLRNAVALGISIVLIACTQLVWTVFNIHGIIH